MRYCWSQPTYQAVSPPLYSRDQPINDVAAPCIAFFAIYARTYAQERADENLLKIIMPRP